MRKFLGELYAARAQYNAFDTIPIFPILVRIRSFSTILYNLNIPVPDTVGIRYKISAVDRWRDYITLLIALSEDRNLSGAKAIQLERESGIINTPLPSQSNLID